jgi:hypothetical protein
MLDSKMGKVLACWWLGCSLACGDDVHSCTLKACGAASPSITLVDESGLPVVARGEVQDPDNHPFDCTLSSPTSGCQSNVVFTWGYVGSSSYRLQIRFEQGDGSFTAWQRVDVEIESHTDPDFNGPGCSCTWYTATAAPIVVPAAARMPEP